MANTVYRTCPLCEAGCGVAITTDGDQVVSVRGDDNDPFSQGYICPKGTALGDLHHDPDRLRRPLLREGSSRREIGWDEALDLVAHKLKETREKHGRHAVGIYQGNPTVHNLGLITYGQVLLRTLRTKNLYSATSVDQLPHMLAAMLVFGNQVLMPVPDIDRADLFICLGANPIASNGSIMTAPDVKRRLDAIRARGGKVIVVDPRRSETADRADQHVFLRPGTDAVLLLAMLHHVFANGLDKLRIPANGIAELRDVCAKWSPDRASPITGVPAQTIRDLAEALATTPRAVLYGRIGVCAQQFGGLAAWLCYVVNAVTGHLDAPGGLMFSTPAVDPVPLAGLLGFDGGFRRWKSRVSGKPEFGGELPVTAFLEELETEGPGRIRALITSAGNPALSLPGGPRLERAFEQLDFMVSIDPYLNETTKHAHVILPPASPLERSHYDLALNAFAVRNVAKYSPETFQRPADSRHDWEICLGLLTRMQLGVAGPAASLVLGKLGPEAIVEVGLRIGPHGLRRGFGGLSLAKLKANPHGIDLGPLEPRLPARLGTPDKRIQLAPKEYLDDLPRLEAHVAKASNGLVMIGRRQLRSNNSWMHNSQRLVKGPARCTMLIHPEDAAARQLENGSTARVSTGQGAIEVPVEVSDEIMRGVVSIPHGWGHHRKGVQLSVATAHAGVSVNDILDPNVIDELSGTTALTGQPVEVAKA